MLRAFFRDMEFSCDETILKRGKYSSDETAVYASACYNLGGKPLSLSFQVQATVRIMNAEF